MSATTELSKDEAFQNLEHIAKQATKDVELTLSNESQDFEIGLQSTNRVARIGFVNTWPVPIDVTLYHWYGKNSTPEKRI